MQRAINGIQQIGIGVADAASAFAWYKKYFHFDTIVFEDIAEAKLMQQYTGGKVHERYAVLAMNMQGGGGFEIWQYTNRGPKPPSFPVKLGDPGIFAVKLRCRDVAAGHKYFLSEGLHISTININPLGQQFFFVTDPFNNIFQIIEDDYWFHKSSSLIGGVCGIIIGVSQMDAALPFYKNILGYKEEKFANNNTSDLDDIRGNENIEHRVFLKNSPSYCGAFSQLLGPTTIELMQTSGSNKNKIYKDRWWGDLGFMHVCYDVSNMQDHEKICEANGHPLTVNSGESFDMGEASGQFAYNEDPDGTLIEYVETHKVPILKKWGLYLNLKKCGSQKPLPKWIVQCMGFGKKDLRLAISNFTCTKDHAENGNSIIATQPTGDPKINAETHASSGQ